jgi:hypothetical protein
MVASHSLRYLRTLPAKISGVKRNLSRSALAGNRTKTRIAPGLTRYKNSASFL